MFKIATILATTAIAVSITASTAEAGGRGLMTGLFIGAVGAHMMDQSYREERRREAYEAERLRRERAIAAQHAAARAAKYERIQLEKAHAAKIAAASAAANAASTSAQTSTTTSQNSTGTAVVSNDDLNSKAPKPISTATVTTETPSARDTTATDAKTTTVSSTDTADAPTCRKYSPATDSIIETRCP